MRQKNTMYGDLFKAAGVVYPLLIYYVVITVAMSLVTAMAVKLGIDPQKQYMAIQAIATAVTIPFIYYFYRKDRREPTACQLFLSQKFERKSKKEKVQDCILMFLTGAVAGIALNNLIGLTKLEELSLSYQEVESSFFAGGVFFEILGACILTPVLEDMLYRSVLYGRICDILVPYKEPDTEAKKKRNHNNRIMAILFTSFVFGMMHMNMVQFIYATILGIMLTWFVERSGHLLGAVLAHAAANLMSVLRVETPILCWMESSKTVFLVSTAGFAIAAVVLLVIIWKYSKDYTKEVENNSQTIQ